MESQWKTSVSWEMLARSFFGRWEDVGLGNLDKTKLEALLAYCLHIQGVIPADGLRISLAEAHAPNKEPADLDKLIAKGYTLLHKDPISPIYLLTLPSAASYPHKIGLSMEVLSFTALAS